MQKVLLVFGTRPEAVKMCPLLRELRRRAGIRSTVCVTGQHRAMLDQTLRFFGVTPEYDLDIMREGQTLFDVTRSVLEALPPVLERERPNLLLVHGDTSTAFTAALCAFYLGIPVGHVEAGLRTGNLRAPFPEEFDRRAVDLVSRYCFAPTVWARDNLLREGKSSEAVFLTGNTVVDAMRCTLRADYSHPALDWAAGKTLLLFTAHRRESLGEPMRRMFRALRRLLETHAECRALFPVHESPAVRALVREELSGCPGLYLTSPLDVADFHNLEARCAFCLTDSGGIQEECAALGKPVLLMRGVTERPEAVHAGVLRLVGTDPEGILRGAEALLADRALYARMARACQVYGDGHACERIADVIEGGRCDPWEPTAPS